MRILAAFDKFKDSFSAEEACELVEKTAKEALQDIDIISCPLTDGGEGFAEILTKRHKGELVDVEARDSFGVHKKATIGFVDLKNLTPEVCSFLSLPNSGKLAILEMASVCGLSDIEPSFRDPLKTTTLGVGDLLLSAKKYNANFILLGIGGSSTNDAGIGALCGLGLKLENATGQILEDPSPNSWKEISKLDNSSIEALPPLRIACDVDNPLLGKNGATYQFGPQKGLTENNLQHLENEMSQMAKRLAEVFPEALKQAIASGAGAAGGIGFGLSLVGEVKLVSGFDLVSRWLDLENEVSRADFVFTGEGRFDQTSWRGKGPFEILRLAKKKGKKAFLICGSLEQTIKDKSEKEFRNHNFISIARDSWDLSKNLKFGSELFSETCRNIFEDILESISRECPIIKEARFKRIRRLKKFLRPLPRRSNVHRYPVLKWFADTAYQKSFLWSFKGGPVQSALFWGIWISMLPIVGVQMIVVFFVSLIVRANLPLIVALQWISNPFTMGPIYFADFKIGMSILNLLGVDYPQNKLLSPEYDWSEFSFKELVRLIDTFPPMFLGGSVLGIFFGVISVFLYKILSRIYKN